MKTRNRLGALFGALALAVAMVLAPLSALGAAGDRTADTSISVTGLDAGDTATYYQVLKINESTGQWELVGGPYTYADGATTHTITVAELIDGVSAQEAGAIAASAPTTTTGSMTVTTAEGATSATATVNPGLYLVMVTPNDNATIYAPIFVGADYSQRTDSPNTIDASAASLASPPVAVAKKSTLTIGKASTGSTLENEGTASDGSVCVGSTVSFKVETNVPTYTSNVVNPQFKISDAVSTGLEIQGNSLKVKIGEGSEQTVTTGKYYNANGTEGTSTDYDFTVSKLTTGEWEITFSPAYLTTEATGAPKVIVKYDAKVTDAAATANVNEMTNTAKIDYTHLPDGTTAHQEDQTNHYTYSFDMPLASGGATAENSSEFVKVGVDDDGQTVIEQTVIVGESKPTGTSPLAGAVFTLTPATSGAHGAYTSTTSNSAGLFSFTGLDAGRYTLQETSAPKGYQLDTTTYYVEIIPVFTTDANGNKVLASYTVTCGTNSNYQNDVVGAYTITNPGTGNVTATIDTAVDKGSAFFVNKLTPKLPTTGGAGTMALTIGGVVLIAAGIAIVMRVMRRATK